LGGEREKRDTSLLMWGGWHFYFLFLFSVDCGRLMWRFLFAFLYLFRLRVCRDLGVLADLSRIACIGGLRDLFVHHSFILGREGLPCLFTFVIIMAYSR